MFVYMCVYMFMCLYIINLSGISNTDTRAVSSQIVEDSLLLTLGDFQLTGKI